MFEFLNELLHWTLKGEAGPIDYTNDGDSVRISTGSYAGGILVSAYVVAGPLGFFRSTTNLF